VSPAPFWAGAVATSTGLVFTGDMRGYFMAFDARTGTLLWQFQTGSGIIGSPITYDLDGVQYIAVPSGGIGGDMTFYYTEPKAGNIWVFALDGGGPARVAPGSNLVTLKGALPRVGEPGHTLGGRVLPGYGFTATEGGEPIPGAGPPQPTSNAPSSTAQPTSVQPTSVQPTSTQPTSTQPTSAQSAAAQASAVPAQTNPVAGQVSGESNPFQGQAAAIAQGEQIYRERCFGCHKSNGGSGPNVFRPALSATRFFDAVRKGRPGTAMAPFESLLSQQQIWQVHAFLVSRDRL
jgi:mono/diheme cytochrome c family protein